MTNDFHLTPILPPRSGAAIALGRVGEIARPMIGPIAAVASSARLRATVVRTAGQSPTTRADHMPANVEIARANTRSLDDNRVCHLLRGRARSGAARNAQAAPARDTNRQTTG